MNILFATFTVYLISTVHAEVFVCDSITKPLFEMADKLIRLFTVSNTEYKVYRETIKPFIVLGALPKCIDKILALPTELSECTELLVKIEKNPDILEIISIENQRINYENVLASRYDIDPDEVCEVLPKEVKTFYNKVNNLVNNGSSIVTLDNFCKMNTSICNVTDAANIKLVAYLSNGYNPTFQVFITTAQNQDFLRKFSSTLFPIEVVTTVHTPYVSKTDINPIYEACVRQLISFVGNKILNS